MRGKTMLVSTGGLMGARVLGGLEPRSPCSSASFAACIEYSLFTPEPQFPWVTAWLITEESWSPQVRVLTQPICPGVFLNGSPEIPTRDTESLSFSGFLLGRVLWIGFLCAGCFCAQVSLQVPSSWPRGLCLWAFNHRRMSVSVINVFSSSVLACVVFCLPPPWFSPILT